MRRVSTGSRIDTLLGCNIIGPGIARGSALALLMEAVLIMIKVDDDPENGSCVGRNKSSEGKEEGGG